MSVTISFTPFLLIYLANLGAGALAHAICRNCNELPNDLLEEKTLYSSELQQILFPHLHAARNRAAQAAAATTNRGTETVIAEPRHFVRETLMQDLDWTRKTLESLGGRSHAMVHGAAFAYQECAVLLYRKNEESNYELWIVGNIDEKKADAIAGEIETEFQRLVQEHVHEVLLARSAECGLALESEEIQEDRSIVLTFTL